MSPANSCIAANCQFTASSVFPYLDTRSYQDITHSSPLAPTVCGGCPISTGPPVETLTVWETHSVCHSTVTSATAAPVKDSIEDRCVGLCPIVYKANFFKHQGC